MGTGLRQVVSRRILARWARAADAAPTMPLGRLRLLRALAQELRVRLDRLIASADARLGGVVASPISAPLNTDWTWRPASWSVPIRPATLGEVRDKTAFGPEVTVFHDAQLSNILLRQTAANDPEATAPFHLSAAAFDFDGTYLSLVFDLPEAATAGLNRRYVLRMVPTIEAEHPTEVFARLNIIHGPNTEHIVREIPMAAADKAVEFDLAYTKVNEKRVDRLWLDFIIGQPRMNRVTIRDLTFSRRPRAEL